jgi:hypothetical protein
MRIRPYYPRVPLLPRLLFCSTAALAVVLAGIVLLAPLLDPGDPLEGGWSQLVAVFARDLAVRRIALGSSLGLLITACVFFRAPFWRRRERRPPGPPWHNVVGA